MIPSLMIRVRRHNAAVCVTQGLGTKSKRMFRKTTDERPCVSYNITRDEVEWNFSIDYAAEILSVASIDEVTTLRCPGCGLQGCNVLTPLVSSYLAKTITLHRKASYLHQDNRADGMKANKPLTQIRFRFLFTSDRAEYRLSVQESLSPYLRLITHYYRLSLSREASIPPDPRASQS